MSLAVISAAAVKFHLSLNVRDLARSVAFYTELFGVPAAKHEPDYAKFELEDPPVVLSLEPSAQPRGGTLNHAGLRFGDSTTLVAAQRRLELAGIPTQREEGVECCYARQTKFWVTDPDQTLWELYILHEDIEHRGAGHVPAVGQTQPVVGQTQPSPPVAKPTPAAKPISGASQLTRTAEPTAVWHHTLIDPVPTRIAHDDNRLDEVRLLGTFNLPLSPTETEALLAEVFRTLKPGGKLFLHNLVAAAPLTTRPNLPGPASLVQHIPLEHEPITAAALAGFVGLHFAKLGISPCFQWEGVELREAQIFGTKPAAGCAGPTRDVIYKGPLQSVTDDEGHTFVRGQRVAVCGKTWDALQNSVVAAQFAFLGTSQAGGAGCG